MDKQKLILPISILLGCIILGGFFYASQINKQKSIEKQQEIDLAVKRDELQIKQEIDQAQIDRDKADTTFNNNLKCQTLLKDLKQRWSNVVGIYYDEWENTCIVKYTKNGKTEEGAIEGMQDTK